MARPVNFHREQVLQDAMLLFWRKGYNKTSMRDLTEATHLQPGSLYAAFSDKRNLFLNSLDYYAEELQGFTDAVLRNNTSPLQRIHQFFDHLINEAADDRQIQGCLLVNTLLEVPTEDNEINQRVVQALIYVEDAFAEVLAEALEQGELRANADPVALARLLITGIFGLRVYEKMKRPSGTLNGIVKNLLSILDE